MKMHEVMTYLHAVPPKRQQRLQTLHDMILELYPDATVDMTYKMPTYRVGEGWVAIANQKNYVALYTCGSHHLERIQYVPNRKIPRTPRSKTSN